MVAQCIGNFLDNNKKIKIRRNASSQTDENLVILNSVGVQTEDPLLTDILDGIQKLDDEIKQLGIQKTKKNVSIQTDENLEKEQKSFAWYIRIYKQTNIHIKWFKNISILACFMYIFSNKVFLRIQCLLFNYKSS